MEEPKSLGRNKKGLGSVCSTGFYSTTLGVSSSPVHSLPHWLCLSVQKNVEDKDDNRDPRERVEELSSVLPEWRCPDGSQ